MKESKKNYFSQEDSHARCTQLSIVFYFKLPTITVNQNFQRSVLSTTQSMHMLEHTLRTESVQYTSV